MSIFQVNDIVDYHSIIGGPITSKGHKITNIGPTPSSHGEDVAWISGKSGCVSLDAISMNDDYLADLEGQATCEHGFLVGCPSC